MFVNRISILAAFDVAARWHDSFDVLPLAPGGAGCLDSCFFIMYVLTSLLGCSEV